jgi:ADP-ribosyl-[dinitrogen reductase] hydrolase
MGEEPREPLVDRELEFALIRDHLGRMAREASGYGIILLGESGVGKTRIVQEALREAGDLNLQTMAARCVGCGAEPLLPIKDSLAAYLGGRSQARIRGALLRAAPRLLDAIPFVGSFLGTFGESMVEAKDLRVAGSQGVYEEVARVLLGLAHKRGLCLVVEDLHAADQDTIFFLNYFLRKVRDHRVVALATIQQEQLDDAPHLADFVAQWSVDGYSILTVLPLERAHVGEYVHTVTAVGGAVDDRLVDRLFTLTGGNPFFLKETVRLLTEQGADGAKVLTGEAPFRLPRADAVLQQRLSRVSAETRRFLDAAAVVLETAQELEPMAHVADIDLETSVRLLNEACEQRLMTEAEGGEISFVHALMQRTVYAGLGYNYRRQLHGRAAGWFEQADRFTPASFHYDRAGRVADMMRTALAAASQAERAGMYHSALILYQKVRPHMAIEELGPRLGRALIVLGDWKAAQELVELLPADDGRVRLLRSDLWFAMGDFQRAEDEAQAAVDDPVDRFEVLSRLGGIHLHLGRFDSAQRYAREALVEAERSRSVNQRVTCLVVIGTTMFHSGDVDGAEKEFTRALHLLLGAPDADRDRTLHAVVLGQLGFVAEVRQDWGAAKSSYTESLRIRREVADALGACHSLRGIGRMSLRLGDRDGGMQLLNEADKLGRDLGEALGRAKVTLARAEMLLADGDCAGATTLASQALDAFKTCSTHYDVTETSLLLSRGAIACGDERRGREWGAAARSSIRRRGYGLLARLYADVGFSLADRIAAAITAYACADALGLPWEAKPPAHLSEDEVERLPAREGWSRGATSDDTALTLLVARYLIEQEGGGDAASLLRMIAQEAPSIPGLGPSTTAAIEQFQRTGEPPTSGGTTNGAAMRAMPVGWVTPIHRPEQRRQLALELSRATHPSAEAGCAACVIAACAAWAIEGASPRLLTEIAVEEAAAASRLSGADPRLGALLAAVASGTWTPSPQGVSLDAYDTVAAVLACVAGSTSLRGAIHRAISIGGDTDTVAALTAGLLGAGMTREVVLQALPWYPAVRLPEAAGITGISASLAALRAAPDADADAKAPIGPAASLD